MMDNIITAMNDSPQLQSIVKDVLFQVNTNSHIKLPSKITPIFETNKNYFINKLVIIIKAYGILLCSSTMEIKKYCGMGRIR